MGERKGYDHVTRPKTGKTWCGLPVIRNANHSGAHREVCPECKRRQGRGKP